MTRDATFKIIYRGWLNVNEKFIQYYNDYPQFVNSLYFDWQKNVLGEQKHPNSNNKWHVVNYISILIFQAWEDFITASKIDETGSVVWFNNFLQWSNSHILANNWQVLSPYNPRFWRLFIVYLINI